MARGRARGSALLEVHPQPATTVNPGAPSFLSAIAAKCLEKDPAARPTFTDILTSLDRKAPEKMRTVERVAEYSLVPDPTRVPPLRVPPHIARSFHLRMGVATNQRRRAALLLRRALVLDPEGVELLKLAETLLPPGD
jgi:hypothetical protein